MILARDLDSPETNDPAVFDRYMARASNLASRNNPYNEIHRFVNHDKTVTGSLKVDTSRMGGRPVDVLLNGKRADSFRSGGWYEHPELSHGDVLRLQAVPAGVE